MASIVLKSLSVLLGIFFIFVGTTKLTPKISKELHKDLRKEFARYSKVFPLAQTLEFKIPSKWYRRTVGGLEVLCGFCLTFIPSKRIKQMANLILVVMMLFATYNHWMVGDKFERLAPSLVFFFMLTCRMIVEYQIRRKEKEEKLSLKKPAAASSAKEAGVDGAAGSVTSAAATPPPPTVAAESRAKKED
ncbi:novel acetylcholine receptor chaperone-like [Penaeus chinensis]|uniref:novel acetylcholine receptor chaperone-like n=1 Tax=Penaeus chinensis TaxID=139456 RepID=UPI001FB5AF92|nr:novel acetylcholine receptor chaperone-like [Penaeus chinensis]